jgi:hypothetical protein
MESFEVKGAYGGQQYVGRLREEALRWRLDSLVVGDLPREFEDHESWAGRDEAAAAVAAKVASYIDSGELHSYTTTAQGYPLGGG